MISDIVRPIYLIDKNTYLIHNENINNNVPISIVKYLLSKGAYKNLNIRVNGQKHHILHDMDEMSDGRYARIKDLVNNFEKRDKKN